MPYYLNVLCMNCKKQFNNTPAPWNERFLNGIPKRSVIDLLDSMEICECGFLAHHDGTSQHLVSIFQSDAYQNALKQQYDSECEKKLTLLELMYNWANFDLYWAKYYQEVGNNEKYMAHMQKAVDRILRCEDEINLWMHVSNVGIEEHFDPYNLIRFTAECRLVDIYRCMGRWDAAQKQILKIKMQPPIRPNINYDGPARKYTCTQYSWQAYLKYETALIAQRNSEWM